MEKRFLDREAILSLDDTVIEEVHVPEWDAWVRVKSLTGEERDAIEAQLFVEKGKDKASNFKNLRAKYCAAALVDSNGRRMFTDAHVIAIGRKRAAALQRIFDKVQEMNAVTDKDVEELGNGSEGDQSDDSGSASPSLSAVAP